MRPVATSLRTSLPQPPGWFNRGNRLPLGADQQSADEPRANVDTLGFMGLQATLAGYRDGVPATTVLLAGMIHAMGGAPTSVASGAYLNIRI